MRITVAPTGINATSAACFSRFTKAVHSDTSIGFPATAAGGLPNGAGVAARVAIEQAAACDPTHRMMQLVGQMPQEACTSGDVRVGPGGRNLEASFDTFAKGYTNTARLDLTVSGGSGDHRARPATPMAARRTSTVATRCSTP